MDQAFHHAAVSLLVFHLHLPFQPDRLLERGQHKMAGYVLPRALILLGFYVAASTFVSIHSAPWRQVLRLTFPYIYYVPMVLMIL